MNQLAPTSADSQQGTGVLDLSSLESAMRVASILADSTMIPKDFQRNVGNVLVAIQWGQELGLQPLQAMQNIAVINGRPSLWGDAVLALVRGSGLLDSIEETVTDQEATCTVKRKGENPVTRTFSMEDASKANLAGKAGPWQQYPKRMLQMRARGFAIRDVFPDVLRGMAIAEEAQDEPAMRDVTPEEPRAANTATASVKAKVLGKASEPKAEAPDDNKLQAVLDKIASADSVLALEKLASDAAALSVQADKQKARDAYSARLRILKSQPPTPDLEQFEHLSSMIITEIQKGGDHAEIRETFAEQLQHMATHAPDLLERVEAEFGSKQG